jgi:flagellar basal-body rod modification protein FlgD
MLDSNSLVLGGLGTVDAKAEAAKKSLGQTYDQFLTLLTTQLKNQDPLNPMDSKDFTGQLIAMANTEQQIAQTEKMNELIRLNQSSSINQALNYIGLDVTYEGDQFNNYTGYSTTLKYALEDSGTKGRITILDSNDQVVWSRDLATMEGMMGAGEHTVTWDGKKNDGTAAPAGSYKFVVAVQNNNDAAIKSRIAVPGLVTGIDTSADGQVLLVVGAQRIPISSVMSAYVSTSGSQNPPATEPPPADTPPPSDDSEDESA